MIDFQHYKNESVSEKVAEITEGKGTDVVIELAGAATWDESTASAGMRGRVIVIGSHGGIRANLNLGEVFGKHLNIIGVTRANRATMNKLFNLVAEEKLNPVIYKTFTLGQVGEAHEAMEQREHLGKIVLTLNT